MLQQLEFTCNAKGQMVYSALRVSTEFDSTIKVQVSCMFVVGMCFIYSGILFWVQKLPNPFEISYISTRLRFFKVIVTFLYSDVTGGWGMLPVSQPPPLPF